MKENFFSIFDAFKDDRAVLRLIERLKNKALSRPLKVMHVCGTHENAIGRFGIREILPQNLSVIAGPGCPVCVCPVEDIYLARELSRLKDVIVLTFGDMMRVPAPCGSLSDARMEDGDIRIVYGPFDAVKVAEENPDKEAVFFAVGFETTACGVASLIGSELPQNLSFIISHRLIPPALDFLLKTGEVEIDGFILPGHVSAIIGLVDYIPIIKRYKIPSVVAGFEPVDIIMGLLSIVDQVESGESICANSYTRAVEEKGNPLARKAMKDAFDIVDALWRGIGVIPGSGYALKERFKERDGRRRFSILPSKEYKDEGFDCSCAGVMLGKINPDECPLFSNKCTPDTPVGPCMVSFEGTCSAWYKKGAWS